MEQSFELSCEVSSVFPALKPTSHFLPRKTIFSMVICNFKSQLKLLAQIGSLIKFRLERCIIIIDSNITDDVSGRLLLYRRKRVVPRVET